MNQTLITAAGRLSRSVPAISGRMIVWSAILVSCGCQKTHPEQSDQRQTAISTPGSAEDTNSPTQEDTNSSTPSEPPSFPLEVTDGLNRTISLPSVPHRIVSLAPRITEILFALGAEDQIVGVTSYCNYPPAAERIERVGGFSSKSLSLERIVSFQPDLVISIGEMHAPIIAELERLHLPVLALTADSFGGLCDELRLLGRITGHADQAAQLSSNLRDRIERVKKISAGIPADQRVTVFYQVWDDPLIAAGPASYIGEMIQLCGGLNMIDDSTSHFPNISLEILLARNPAVIVSSNNHSDLFTEENLKSKPELNGLRAVRDKRIHLIDGDIVSRLSPRSMEALELMAYALYPSYFPVPPVNPTNRENGDGVKP